MVYVKLLFNRGASRNIMSPCRWQMLLLVILFLMVFQSSSFLRISEIQIDSASGDPDDWRQNCTGTIQTGSFAVTWRLAKRTWHIPGHGRIKFIPAEAMGTIDSTNASSYLSANYVQHLRHGSAKTVQIVGSTYKDLSDEMGAVSMHIRCSSCSSNPSNQKK